MDKNTAIWNWIKTYPNFEKLFYNFGTADDKTVQVIPIATDYKISEDICGNEKRHYDFAVTAFLSFDESTPQGLENLVDFNEIQAFIEWVNAQNKARSFPTFDSGCEIEAVTCLQNIPTTDRLANNLAKYMIQCRVVYTEIYN